MNDLNIKSLLLTRQLKAETGSYSEDIIKIVAANSNLFYIRANRCEALTERIRQGRQWKIRLYTDKPYEKFKFT